MAAAAPPGRRICARWPRNTRGRSSRTAPSQTTTGRS